MTEHDIAHKYVHGLHDALTDSQEKKDMANDIINFAKEYHKKQLLIDSVVEQSELLTGLVRFERLQDDKYKLLPLSEKIEKYLAMNKINR